MMIGQRRPSWQDGFAGGGQPMAPLNVPQVALPAAPTPAPEHKINWGAIIADALSGLAGQQGQYPARIERQRQEQTALERGEQQYRRQRADSEADWNRNKEWELANRAPQTWEDNGGNRWKMGPDGKPVEIFHDNIPKERWVFDPVRGYVNIGEMTQPQRPTAPVGKLVPLGGQTPPASGGFLKGGWPYD